MGADTLVHRLAQWAERRPDRAALHGVRGTHRYTVTWSDYWRNARDLAAALIELGHRPGECVAMIGANYPEWVEYQMAIQAAGGVPAPIYMTNTEAQAGYIVAHCGAKIAVVDGAPALEKLLLAEGQALFPPLEHILSFAPIEGNPDPRVIHFDEVLGLGRDASDDTKAERDRRIDALRDDDTCLLIYTSGTTGTPKAVELDHAGQLVVGGAVGDFYPAFFEEGRYRAVSYLPLTAQAEQVFTNVFALMTGGEVHFCPAIADVRAHLLAARPSVFLGMPRVWEKLEAALRARFSEATGARAWLLRWAMHAELSAFDAQVTRGDPDYLPLTRRLARRLVIDEVRAGLGMDRLELAFSGSAPLSPETQRFFASVGVCIYEGYGLSETSGVATVTDYAKPRFGTVGKPLRGVEVRLADDGEVQLRGRNMTRGYRGMPEETAALFTDDGWMHTGDLGAFDREGNLRITGRIKELLITAGGKNVAPVELESYLRTIEGVGQAVVVGDRRPYLCALVTLDPEVLRPLAEAAGVSLDPGLVDGAAMAYLARQPEIRGHIEREAERCCNAKVARYQTIKRIAVLPNELTTEGGELTANLKLRRGPIADKYADVIEALYAPER